MSNIVDFASNIKELLSQTFNFNKETKYLDLAEVTTLDKELLLKLDKISPEQHPVAEAKFLIIKTMKDCNLTQTKIGINELLKAFLKTIEKDNEKICTETFTECIFEIYLYSLQKDYPFTDLVWSYLSNCFHVVSQFLVEEGYVAGCEIFLQHIAAMGKTAAQKGLHTSSIQHFLHTLEMRAQELELPELAAVAKNHRFNLEIF
ncbi:MAG: hypothetical protein ACOYVD_09445 [Bacillota bacterium]